MPDPRHPSPRQALLWRWLWTGALPTDGATLTRKILQINAGAAIGIATICLYNLAFWWIDNPALNRAGWVQLPVAMALPLVWRLNAGRRFVAARWLLMTLVMADALAAILAGMGTALNIHVYYLLFAVLAPTLFGVEQRWGTALVAIANLGLYLYFEAHGWPSDPAIHLLAPEWHAAMFISMVMSCGLVVILMGWITEVAAEANERHLQERATTDPLTGLANRRRFIEALNVELSRQAREGAPLSVLMLDLDHFKRVNDEWGHEAGDLALQHVSFWAADGTRPYDVLARLGGEEFAVLLPRTGPHDALLVAERLRALLAEASFAFLGRLRTITVSVGLAVAREGDSWQDVLRRADAALYQAKREGRNRVCVAP